MITAIIVIVIVIVILVLGLGSGGIQSTATTEEVVDKYSEHRFKCPVSNPMMARDFGPDLRVNHIEYFSTTPQINYTNLINEELGEIK